jgi:hypothetical protein
MEEKDLEVVKVMLERCSDLGNYIRNGAHTAEEEHGRDGYVTISPTGNDADQNPRGHSEREKLAGSGSRVERRSTSLPRRCVLSTYTKGTLHYCLYPSHECDLNLFDIVFRGHRLLISTRNPFSTIMRGSFPTRGMK